MEQSRSHRFAPDGFSLYYSSRKKIPRLLLPCSLILLGSWPAPFIFIWPSCWISVPRGGCLHTDPSAYVRFHSGLRRTLAPAVEMRGRICGFLLLLPSLHTCNHCRIYLLTHTDSIDVDVCKDMWTDQSSAVNATGNVQKLLRSTVKWRFFIGIENL